MGGTVSRSTRIIIAGSRHATYAQVRAAASSCPWFVGLAKRRAPDVVIVSGRARGADTHGETIARRCGWRVEGFPADWSKGKAAGPARNARMAEFAKDSEPFGGLIACWDGRISGTANMVHEACERGLLVHVFDTRIMEPVSMLEHAGFIRRYGVERLKPVQSGEQWGLLELAEGPGWNWGRR